MINDNARLKSNRKKYRYYISYMYPDGHGNILLSLPSKIKTLQQLKIIKSVIIKRYNLDYKNEAINITTLNLL